MVHRRLLFSVVLLLLLSAFVGAAAAQDSTQLVALLALPECGTTVDGAVPVLAPNSPEFLTMGQGANYQWASEL